MNVTNNADYNNTILQAIVVNTDTSMDPEGKERIQIYIPSIHWEFQNIYQEYMNAGNKEETGHKDKFPWAVNLVQGLDVGNTVYISNINNKDSQYIIVGAETNTTTNYYRNYTSGGANLSGDISIYNVGDGSVVDYAMPIIIHNEVGIDVSAWPDNIPDSYYANINPADNGGWSIGLIQWHECRAYDMMQYITYQDNSWADRFSDKGSDLYKDLASGSTNARTKYGASYHPGKGSILYNSIQNVISGSTQAKWAQRSFASQNVSSDISKCTNAGVTNVAILIFLADIMNQYGPNLPDTIRNAAQISNNNSAGASGQFNSFVSYCKNNPSLHYDKYHSRRSTTIEYINQLFGSGKISDNGINTSGVQKDIVSSGINNPGGEPISMNGLNIANGNPGAYGLICPVSSYQSKAGHVTCGYTGYSGHTGIDLSRN